MEDLFLSDNNISLIWEILLENTSFLKISEKKRENVRFALNKDMALFFDQFKTKHYNVLDLNKQFLGQIITILQEKEKINNSVKKSVLFKDTLEEKKKEMEHYLNKIKPPEINFADKIVEEKIKNIDELIKNTISERKYEIHNPPVNNILYKKNKIMNKNKDIEMEEDKKINLLDKRLLILETKIEIILQKINQLSFNSRHNSIDNNMNLIDTFSQDTNNEDDEDEHEEEEEIENEDEDYIDEEQDDDDKTINDNKNKNMGKIFNNVENNYNINYDIYHKEIELSSTIKI